MLSLFRKVLHVLFSGPNEVWPRREHSEYRVKCPNDHIFTLPRDLVLRMDHTDSGIARIDYGLVNHDEPIPISYLDCPHSSCEALARQGRISTIYTGQ
jgi:hypothetical protein